MEYGSRNNSDGNLSVVGYSLCTLLIWIWHEIIISCNEGSILILGQQSSEDKIIVKIGVILIHQWKHNLSSNFQLSYLFFQLFLKGGHFKSWLKKLDFYIKYYHVLWTANERDLRNTPGN